MKNNMKVGKMLMVLALVIGILPLVYASNGFTDETETCGNGLGQSNVHLGFNEYHLNKINDLRIHKMIDPRPWFRNILRGERGIEIFSRLEQWQLCAAEQ